MPADGCAAPPSADRRGARARRPDDMLLGLALIRTAEISSHPVNARQRASVQRGACSRAMGARHLEAAFSTAIMSRIGTPRYSR